ncbi:hypothetical protein BD779DRAFT_1547414 [Infundibulicybe gibba]|nr:hypothetical protein BD779DRAFT_1547414 [Infundibulicybe gibba]
MLPIWSALEWVGPSAEEAYEGLLPTGDRGTSRFRRTQGAGVASAILDADESHGNCDEYDWGGDAKVYRHIQEQSSVDKLSSEDHGTEHKLDGVHDGLEFPTEYEWAMLGRVSNSIPWNAHLITFVELADISRSLEVGCHSVVMGKQATLLINELNHQSRRGVWIIQYLTLDSKDQRSHF